jgi:hypothetical protein
VHVLVPGNWTVHRGHQLLEDIEAEIRAALPATTLFTHLEALDDPTSFDDTSLDRDRVPHDPAREIAPSSAGVASAQKEPAGKR